MPKFQVRLESQTDAQSREVTLTADSEKAARDRCEQLEREYCAYSLDSDPYLAGDDAARIRDTCAVDDAGKVVWDGVKPSARDRGKAHLDWQTKPYKVVSVEQVGLSDAHITRLASELAGLQQDEKAWKRTLAALKKQGVPLAAVTGFMYGVPVKNQYDGTAVVDYDTDTMKVALLTGHTPAQDTHDFFNDVSSNEITGTGYTAGGATLGTKTITYDTASDQIRMDAADTTWTTSTLSATHAVVYKSTGTSSTSPLMGLIDFGATVTTTAGTFQITWDSTGIIVLDVT